MDFHLDCKVALNTESEFKSLYSWSLQEFDDGGNKKGRAQIPWSWSLDFTAIEWAYFSSIELRSDYKGGTAEPAIKASETEVIWAKLRPGWPQDDQSPPSYSMFGTNRTISDFTLRVRKIESGEVERCVVSGSVGYTFELDFRKKTSEDTLEIDLFVKPDTFARYADIVRRYSADVAYLRLGGASGFYSDWSPSIYTDFVKVLVNLEDQKVELPHRTVWTRCSAAMQYQLKIFEYENHQKIRTVETDGEVWFVMNDVCRELEIANPSDTASRLDDDEKDALGITDPMGRTQRMTVINESGLYTLILTSRKPSARKFKRWVTHEVLPQIRRTGSYSVSRGVPVFVRRFNDNWDRVDAGYFSVISELFIRVYGRFERVGYMMPDKGDSGKEMRPDVSVGLLFPKWLKANHPHLINCYTMYDHLLPDKNTCEARQYEMEVVPAFNRFVDEVWLPLHGPDYFKSRDRKALNYLPLLLPKPKKRAG